MTKRLAALVGLLLFTSTLSSQAVFTFSDIAFWSGSGANQAALVIDWIDPYDSSQDLSLAWGWRFDGSPSGLDMMNAINAVDPRLSFDDLGGGYIVNIGFDENLDGTPDYFHDDWDGTSFWAQWEGDGAPYDGGAWVSGFGVGSQTLSDGTWTGWRYTDWPGEAPREPMGASAIPEPGSTALVLVGILSLLARRIRHA